MVARAFFAHFLLFGAFLAIGIAPTRLAAQEGPVTSSPKPTSEMEAVYELTKKYAETTLASKGGPGVPVSGLQQAKQKYETAVAKYESAKVAGGKFATLKLLKLGVSAAAADYQWWKENSPPPAIPTNSGYAKKQKISAADLKQFKDTLTEVAKNLEYLQKYPASGSQGGLGGGFSQGYPPSSFGMGYASGVYPSSLYSGSPAAVSVPQPDPADVDKIKAMLEAADHGNPAWQSVVDQYYNAKKYAANPPIPFKSLDSLLSSAKFKYEKALADYNDYAHLKGKKDKLHFKQLQIEVQLRQKDYQFWLAQPPPGDKPSQMPVGVASTYPGYSPPPPSGGDPFSMPYYGGAALPQPIPEVEALIAKKTAAQKVFQAAQVKYEMAKYGPPGADPDKLEELKKELDQTKYLYNLELWYLKELAKDPKHKLFKATYYPGLDLYDAPACRPVQPAEIEKHAFDLHEASVHVQAKRKQIAELRNREIGLPGSPDYTGDAVDCLNPVEISKAIADLGCEIQLLLEGARPSPKVAKALKSVGSEKIGQALDGWFESVMESDPAFAKLEPEELLMIRLYSGSTYTTLNSALRNREKDPKTYEDVHDAIDILNSGLSKLPDYLTMGDPPNFVRRGANLPADVLAEHQVGSIVNYAAFTSTSRNSGFGSRHTFQIISKHGKNIEKISSATFEAEVLFRSDTRFKVLSRKQVEDAVQFVMEEVDDQ